MAAPQKDGSDQNFDYMFKLLIIGNSSVGKTSFLFRYADDSFTSAFVSTVGIDFKVKTVYKNDKRVKLQIWVSWLTSDGQQISSRRPCVGIHTFMPAHTFVVLKKCFFFYEMMKQTSSTKIYRFILLCIYGHLFKLHKHSMWVF